MIRILKYLTALLLLVTLLPGCTAIQALKLINSSEAVIKNDIDSVIPFIIEGHQILVKVKVNYSKKEYTFILDTGALTMMSEKVVKELSLPKGIEVNAGGTGGNTKTIKLVQLDSVIVGSMEVKNCASGLIADFHKIFPQRIDGILGSNFLKHFKVTIDYQKKELTLSHDTKPVQVQSNEIRIPIELDMLHGFAPVVECELDGVIKDQGVIDTGLYGYIALPITMKDTPSFKNGSVVTSQGSMSFGMFGLGKKEDYALRLNNVKIGNLKFQNVPAKSHSHNDGRILIGNKFLEKYIVVLNYPAEELILRPLALPFEHNIPTYGIGLTRKDQKTIVSGVWRSSVAFNKGLRTGDEIIRINSIETSTIQSVFDLMVMFTNEDSTSLTVELLNGNGRSTVVLQKENLLPVLE